MTLATFNHYVDNVTGVNKTALLSGRHGARHVGARESALNSLIRIAFTTQAQGKHAKIKSRHGKKK